MDVERLSRCRKKMLSKEEQLHEEWMSRRISSFNYSKDAKLEAMMNYPKRQLIYRKHVDIDKRYERTTKYYKICQNWCNNDRNRQIRDTEEKFTKLLQHTFHSTPTKTYSLVCSYNKWMSRSLDQEDFDKIFESNMRDLKSSNAISKLFKQTPYTVGHESRLSVMRRAPSHRSRSADVVVQSVDVKSKVNSFRNKKPTLKLQKAFTSIN